MRATISRGCARRGRPSRLDAKKRAMPTHAEQRVLPYRPEQLYDLVAGVERYPEFLPWCRAARITKREGDVLFADLVIAFKVFRERFSSKVTLHPQTKIDVEYINGPFRYLKNHWQFAPHPDGCLLDFYVDFEFKSTNPAEPDRPAVQRGGAPHGRCLRDPGAAALHAGRGEWRRPGPARATRRRLTGSRTAGRGLCRSAGLRSRFACAPTMIHSLSARAEFSQQGDRHVMALGGRRPQRGPAVAVIGIRVGATLDQQLDHPRVARARRLHQWCRSADVETLDGGATTPATARRARPCHSSRRRGAVSWRSRPSSPRYWPRGPAAAGPQSHCPSGPRRAAAPPCRLARRGQSRRP